MRNFGLSYTTDFLIITNFCKKSESSRKAVNENGNSESQKAAMINEAVKKENEIAQNDQYNVKVL